jgi:succinate-acetate transporter protein
MSNRLYAEFIGTAWLVLGGCGSAVLAAGFPQLGIGFAGVALAFGGLAQLLAGMWEFRKGNVFGATVFSSYGAFWLSFWAYLTFYADGIPAEHHGVAAGWYLIAWAIFTTLMLVAALRTTAVLATLFAVVAVVFVLLALGAFGMGSSLTTMGGILGLVAAGLAWYLCLAAVGASTFGRPILPNPPLFRS